MRYCLSSVAVYLLFSMLFIIAAAFLQEAECTSSPTPPASPVGDDLGYGFQKDVYTTGLMFGYGKGEAVFGSQESHDLVIAVAHFGKMLTGPIGSGWYRGNLEVRGELSGGVQYKPEGAYVVGIAPVFRYNFLNGSRFVPFVEAGAGVALTDIGEPDLGSLLQFTPRAGVGTLYFLRSDLALYTSIRWLHLSNAGLEKPNTGVNTLMLYLGASWFFH